MRKKLFKKTLALFLASAAIASSVAGCGNSESSKTAATTTTSRFVNAIETEISIDTSTTYQTITGFGASGAWWSQIVGGWVSEQSNGLTSREYIAQLLFDEENGIGLDIYRYNLGGGSAEMEDTGISDVWRRAYSFVSDTDSSEYDWSKDENAIWFVEKAAEYGLDQIIVFANSPIASLTINGHAYGDATSTSGRTTTSNLAEENYEAYADYYLDVIEHFIEEGYPITEISPINEPQWEWTGGQEGCHYTADEVVALLKVFLAKMEERGLLDTIKLSAPEGGEWGNTENVYTTAIFSDETLAAYFAEVGYDCHSYWSDTAQKTSFLNLLDSLGYGDITLNETEWCEMVNGTDYTMDSALNLVEIMNEDLTLLNVASWQYWIAVSCYTYRDGLIYVTTTNEVIVPYKRLWAMGNYSRYIDPGYVRVDTDFGISISGSAYTGNNGESDELVIVLINDTTYDRSVDISDYIAEYGSSVGVYVTDADHNLEDVTSEFVDGNKVLLGGNSVTTIVLTK